jgi:TPR repeat protein
MTDIQSKTNSIVMNDLDLAKALSPESGNLLTTAKESREDYPAYCLVTLRALCKQICQLVIKAKALGAPKNASLADLINTINEKLKLDQLTIDALHALRDRGNQGAHPEQFQFNTSHLDCLVRAALEDAITALIFAHTQIHPDRPLPDRIEAAPVGDGLKTLSYKATIEGQPEAQYLIGEHFREKAEELERESEQNSPEVDPALFFKVPAIRIKSHFWYESAANQKHPKAMYEYGRLLIDGIEGAEHINRGVNSVFMAAELGNADANGYAGEIFYEGLHDHAQDFVEARKHFELAAREDHPGALMLLGIMYERGQGGPAHPRAALEYTQKSAEAGYPTGQHNLFVHYWKAPEPNKALAISWLNKAADQGFPASLNTLAELILANLIDGKMPQDAVHLFEQSINSRLGDQHTRNQAIFGRARLLASHDDLAKLTSAADSLQRCFEAEQGKGELAQACAELSPTVLSRIRKLIQDYKGTAEEIVAANIIAKYMFDKIGRPLVCRNIALQTLSGDLNDAARAKDQLSSELYQVRLNGVFFPELASSEQQRLRVVPNKSEKTGRKNLCPCGSGKKFKKCCEL